LIWRGRYERPFCIGRPQGRYERLFCFGRGAMNGCFVLFFQLGYERLFCIGRGFMNGCFVLAGAL